MTGIQTTSDLRVKEVEQIIKEEVSAELVALGEHLAGVVQMTIRDKGAVASGALLGSITPVHDGEAIKVGTPLEYGAPVEGGTRPHWPPYDPIRQWVELKKSQFTTLASGVKFEGGRAISTRKGTKRVARSREVAILDSIAHAIQRKIAARGTQGRYFMRDSLNSLGIRYEVAQEDGEMVYYVDVAGFIDNRGDDLWARIIERLN